MLILGLDIGTSSIGWSWLDDASAKIFQSGVVIFSEGVNRSSQGKEESLNATRRVARQIRRTTWRKRERKARLLALLQHLGWCPRESEALAAWKQLDPYTLRAYALDHRVSLQELGRILYHLNQRRGFKSNRKAATKEDSAIFRGNEGEGKIGITQLAEEIEQGNYRTLGEYLASLNPHEQRRRNRYTLRQMYEQEFEAIWQAQTTFHKGLESVQNLEVVVDTFCKEKYRAKVKSQGLKYLLKDYMIFFQRGLKSQKSKIGKCTLEPQKRRIAKSSPVFQEFRIWDKLYSLRLTGKDRTDSPLSPTEMQQAFEKLSTTSELEIDRLLKHLNLSDYEANYPKKERIKGNQTAAALIKVVGIKHWQTLEATQKYAMWEVIHQATDNERLIQYAQYKWGLTAEEAQKLTNTKFEEGYGELSHKALAKLLPLMRQGKYNYSQACQAIGYHHSQIAKNDVRQDLLPEPPNLRNPIVQKALYQLKRVVNKLITGYGSKPDTIRVELARELKMPRKQRELIYKENNRQQAEHKRITDQLLEHSSIFHTEANISRNDIIKYKLWEECAKICPYTGRSISIAQLYGGEFEIEHILPYSRSLDDSYNNKTLCQREFNALKGNLSPYEMLAQHKISQEQYDQILERAKGFKRNGTFNYKKFKRFLQQSIDTDFANRQLNDTAYIATEAKKYLSTICADVQVSMGEATATLRQLWGLNKLLNKHGLPLKNREDHRHHALDAIVVALTTRKILKQLADHHAKGKVVAEDKFPLPWDNFRGSVRAALNQILVHQKARKRVRGKLHDETLYGIVLDMNGKPRKNKENATLYTKRKALTSLNMVEVNKIADPVVRACVRERVEAHGGNPDDNKAKIPAGCFAEPLYMPSRKGARVQIKRVRLHEVSNNRILLRQPTESREYKGAYADPGSNHHMIIYQYKTGKRIAKVVSMYEAHQRQQKQLAVIDRQDYRGASFLMSLQRNEMLLIDDAKANFYTASLHWDTAQGCYVNADDTPQTPDLLSPYLYRVQKLDAVKHTITLRHHLTAVLKNEKGEEVGRKMFSPNTLPGIKVRISPLGEIMPADMPQ